MTWTPSTVLSSNGKSRHPCLIRDLRGKAFKLFIIERGCLHSSPVTLCLSITENAVLTVLLIDDRIYPFSMKTSQGKHFLCNKYIEK